MIKKLLNEHSGEEIYHFRIFLGERKLIDLDTSNVWDTKFVCRFCFEAGQRPMRLGRDVYWRDGWFYHFMTKHYEVYLLFKLKL